MNDHVYKKIEVTGSSQHGIQDAIETAVTKSARSVRHMRWFELQDIRGHIEDDRISHWQVTVKIGFDVEGI